jgi:hypothetical protein
MPENIATISNSGYVPDGSSLAPAYLIRIVSYRNRKSVTAILQQDLAIRVESRWEALVPSSLLDVANKLAQGVSGGKISIITAATSRRIWQGTSPLELSVNLKFEAVYDALQEVVVPCQILQTIALPSNTAYSQVAQEELTARAKVGDIKEGIGGIFLAPPGPSPFDAKGLLSRDRRRSPDAILSGLKGGDIIKVDIGRFLSFWNVIVKEVTVQYANKFTKSGDPVSAIVNIVFESYEMMTVESLDDSYKKITPTLNLSEEEKFHGGWTG